MSLHPTLIAVTDRIRARSQENIRIIRSANQGLSLTRNHGAAQARGRYLAFIDADDLVEPEFFAEEDERVGKAAARRVPDPLRGAQIQSGRLRLIRYAGRRI